MLGNTTITLALWTLAVGVAAVFGTWTVLARRSQRPMDRSFWFALAIVLAAGLAAVAFVSLVPPEIGLAAFLAVNAVAAAIFVAAAIRRYRDGGFDQRTVTAIFLVVSVIAIIVLRVIAG